MCDEYFGPKQCFQHRPADKLPQVLADLKAIDGADHSAVTRAFIAKSQGSLLLGLEEGGCLLSPINMGAVPTKLESGANKAGMIGA